MRKVLEAIVKGRSSFAVEGTGIDCNTENAGIVGRTSHKSGCEAEEFLSISIGCTESTIGRQIVERLGKYVEKKVDAEQVHLHVDAKNPRSQLASHVVLRFSQLPDEADRAVGHGNPSR